MNIVTVSRKRIVWFFLKAIALVCLLYLSSKSLLTEVLSYQVITLAVVFLSSSIFISAVRILLVSTYRKRQKLPRDQKDNFILGVDSASNLITILVVVGSLFPIFEIPFGNFITSISLFSVAIAWLFKEYLTNFFDSFRLMFSTEFIIGDYIKVSDTSKGIITDITFRATKVKTDEGDVLFIPNTTLMNSEVTNYSKVKLKRIIVPFKIPLDVAHDIPDLELFLTNAAKTRCSDVVDTNKVFLRVTGISQGEAICAFELSVDTYNFAIEEQIQRVTYEAVMKYSLGIKKA